MQKNLDKQKELILKELQKYMADKTSAKALFESMQEISAWLKQKESI